MLERLAHTKAVGQTLEPEEYLKEFDPSTFGELNAEDYDELHDAGTINECVNLIAELASSGSILELAVGTGRIALPLIERGLSVHGNEGSERMVSKLKAQPGGDSLPVWFVTLLTSAWNDIRTPDPRGRKAKPGARLCAGVQGASSTSLALV
jgi:2-polyprenyl-3-methyl-5-hydroxy-6-metoxy-1,4-benzoquinol methylase